VVFAVFTTNAACARFAVLVVLVLFVHTGP
jgi:hypothetical protein